MNKNTFLEQIRRSLGEACCGDAERSLDYYSEMIDDRIEDGIDEEEAVAALGSPDAIAKQILSELSSPDKASLPTASSSAKTEVGIRWWMILLLVLGSPVWIPLLMAAGMLVLAAYFLLWSLLIMLYAIDLSFAFGSIAFLIQGIVSAVVAEPILAGFYIGGSIFFIGASVLLFFAANQAARGTVFLSKAIFQGILSLFRRKENRV